MRAFIRRPSAAAPRRGAPRPGVRVAGAHGRRVGRPSASLAPLLQDFGDDRAARAPLLEGELLDVLGALRGEPEAGVLHSLRAARSVGADAGQLSRRPELAIVGLAKLPCGSGSTAARNLADAWGGTGQRDSVACSALHPCAPALARATRVDGARLGSVLAEGGWKRRRAGRRGAWTTRPAGDAQSAKRIAYRGGPSQPARAEDRSQPRSGM